MQQLQQQLQAVEQGKAELQKLQLGLDDLKGKKEKEIMANFGRGIYVKAKLLSEDLTVNIGSGNHVTKSIDETKELLGKQIGKLDNIKEELSATLEKTGEELTNLMQEAQKAEQEDSKKK